MSTPHNAAAVGQFAKTVLMPGDPLRSKFIAENFLEDAVLVNNVRGVQGYTGTYKGKKVSVMASGMGMPAIGIYSYELYNFYDVKNIIRVGTAGGLRPETKVKDIVMGMACMTNSNWAAQYEISAVVPPVCSYELLKKAEKAALEIGVTPHIGTIFSSDVFYDSTRDYDKWRDMGVLAVEMEDCEKRYGVDPRVTRLVLPLGMTLSSAGLALYLAVACVTMFQFFNLDASLATQFRVVVMSTLATLGTASVPGGALVSLAIVFPTVGIPLEGIAILAGVDRFSDMIRTPMNVFCDVVAAVAVASSSHLLDKETFKNVA